jgi:CheY-like chemotaxis protein
MSTTKATLSGDDGGGKGGEAAYILVVMADDGSEKLEQMLKPLSYRIERVSQASAAIPLLKGCANLPILVCVATSSQAGELTSIKDIGVPLLFFNDKQLVPDLLPNSDNPMGESVNFPVPLWLLPQWVIFMLGFCKEKNGFEAKVQKGRHDLNNVFGAILGNLHMVMDMADKEAPFFRGLKEIKISGERGREIIKSLYPNSDSMAKLSGGDDAAIKPQQRAEPSQTKSQLETLPNNEQKHVLLVDDDLTLLKMTCALFSHNKIPVYSENDPQVALEIFSADPDSYSMLITDLDMDGMNGVELVGNILKIRPDLPVVMCSGKDESVLVREAQSAGIRHVILKSSPVTDLVKVTKQILNDDTT